jgi:hypothetical protein
MLLTVRGTLTKIKFNSLVVILKKSVPLQKVLKYIALSGNILMEEKIQTTYRQLDNYLKEVRSQGRYTFTLDELRNVFQIQYPAIKQRLHRLKLKMK